MVELAVGDLYDQVANTLNGVRIHPEAFYECKYCPMFQVDHLEQDHVDILADDVVCDFSDPRYLLTTFQEKQLPRTISESSNEVTVVTDSDIDDVTTIDLDPESQRLQSDGDNDAELNSSSNGESGHKFLQAAGSAMDEVNPNVIHECACERPEARNSVAANELLDVDEIEIFSKAECQDQERTHVGGESEDGISVVNANQVVADTISTAIRGQEKPYEELPLRRQMPGVSVISCLVCQWSPSVVSDSMRMREEIATHDQRMLSCMDFSLEEYFEKEHLSDLSGTINSQIMERVYRELLAKLFGICVPLVYRILHGNHGNPFRPPEASNNTNQPHNVGHEVLPTSMENYSLNFVNPVDHPVSTVSLIMLSADRMLGVLIRHLPVSLLLHVQPTKVIARMGVRVAYGFQQQETTGVVELGGAVVRCYSCSNVCISAVDTEAVKNHCALHAAMEGRMLCSLYIHRAADRPLVCPFCHCEVNVYKPMKFLHHLEAKHMDKARIIYDRYLFHYFPQQKSDRRKRAFVAYVHPVVLHILEHLAAGELSEKNTCKVDGLVFKSPSLAIKHVLDAHNDFVELSALDMVLKDNGLLEIFRDALSVAFGDQAWQLEEALGFKGYEMKPCSKANFLNDESNGVNHQPESRHPCDPTASCAYADSVSSQSEALGASADSSFQYLRSRIKAVCHGMPEASAVCYEEFLHESEVHNDAECSSCIGTAEESFMVDALTSKSSLISPLSTVCVNSSEVGNSSYLPANFLPIDNPLLHRRRTEQKRKKKTARAIKQKPSIEIKRELDGAILTRRNAALPLKNVIQGSKTVAAALVAALGTASTSTDASIQPRNPITETQDDSISDSRDEEESDLALGNISKRPRLLVGGNGGADTGGDMSPQTLFPKRRVRVPSGLSKAVSPKVTTPDAVTKLDPKGPDAKLRTTRFTTLCHISLDQFAMMTFVV
uniref:C2H2-type domain-containing protein n=1 Tax=Angiostrongylus cantonensis TaxID=6313 RepID=A0A158PCG7_ANGCA